MQPSHATSPVIPFDQLKQDHWSAQETDNAKAVVAFFQTLMNDHNFDETLQIYGGGTYIQHNRAIPPQIAGVVGYIKSLTKQFPDYSYDVKRIIASGDLVVLHSHVTFQKKHRGNERKGFIITDTFRVQDGVPCEHWDAMQAIDLFSRFLMLLSGGKIANDNPTF